MLSKILKMKAIKELEDEIKEVEWKFNLILDNLDQKGIAYEKNVMETKTGLASFWKAPKEYHEVVEEYLELKFKLLELKTELQTLKEVLKLIEKRINHLENINGDDSIIAMCTALKELKLKIEGSKR